MISITGISLVFLGSIVFSQIWDFERCRPAAFAASKNYTNLITNDDARVTIMGPMFSSADGSTHGLSNTSNLNGPCLLFGFGTAVNAGLQIAGDEDRTIVIDSQGHFEAFRDKAQDYYNYRIVSLMCETGALPSVSSRLPQSPFQNDDGMYTLIGPMFGSADGSVHSLSNTSDQNAVCKLYGFSSAIPAGLQIAGDDDRTVVIGVDSKFSSFRDKAPNYYNYRIVSLMCSR